MKQLLQNFKTGELAVHDVPAPLLHPGGVIVRTHYSVISAGTEGGTARLAKKNLLEKARARPDLVRKVWNLARTDGALAAYEATMRNLDAAMPMGYSTAGEIVEIGSDVADFKVGDKVACFGINIANHADLNYVPHNMCVRLPNDMNLQFAAFGMMGAIAINGIRHAKVDLGCTTLVVGLGLIGQITVQLLAAAGCRVIGVDLDPKKMALAIECGAKHGLQRDEENIEEAVLTFSEGRGVDATIIAATSSTNDPIELAGRVTRQRGRVVALGRVPYELPREEYLFKELEFVTTFSYGPGVGDPTYEEKGIDYPAAYVRWSGNRNVQSFIDLIADGRLNLDKLITHRFDFNDAADAFDLLTGEHSQSCLAILLQYDVDTLYHRPKISLRPVDQQPKREGRPGVGVIGAGSHAVSYLFDAIATQNVDLRGIVSAGGFRSKWYGEKYGFEYAASDAGQLFDDDTIDAVFILSRHDSHADLAIQALQSGKDIFVEKPLCLNTTDLDQIITAQKQHGGRVMVGFNRRFTTLGNALWKEYSNRAEPIVVTYRMNAGRRPADHWLHDVEIGGGLILGEAIHFLDFMQYLVGTEAKRISAHSIHGTSQDVIDADNVVITVEYTDGSLGTLTYTSNGDKSFGRERIEVYCDNSLAVLEDWRSLIVSRNGRRKRKRHLIRQDKGFRQEIADFIAAVADRKTSPICFNDIVNVMQTSFSAIESLRSGMPVELPVRPIST